MIFTTVPFSKLPSNDFIPTGRRLFPLNNAFSAPSSIVTTPFLFVPYASQYFLELIFLFFLVNSVPIFSFSTILDMFFGSSPLAITIFVPILVAISAAIILVIIPPVPNFEPSPPAVFLISSSIFPTISIRFASSYF